MIIDNNADYSINGAFGEVMIAPPYFFSGKLTSINHICSMGWHCVNELYKIHRPEGIHNDLLLFTVRGKGVLEVDDRVYSADSGTLCIVPQNVKNAYYVEKGNVWEFYWLQFTGQCASTALRDIISEMGLSFHFDFVEISRRFLYCMETRFIGLDGEISASDILAKILSTILRYVTVNVANAGSQKLVQEMIDYLESESVCTFQLADISETYHYSKEHLIRVFKQYTGMTPYHYWRYFRIERSARELLYSNSSIAEIARSAGYANTNGYCKQFIKQKSISPSVYRALYSAFQN